MAHIQLRARYFSSTTALLRTQREKLQREVEGLKHTLGLKDAKMGSLSSKVLSLRLIMEDQRREISNLKVEVTSLVAEKARLYGELSKIREEALAEREKLQRYALAEKEKEVKASQDKPDSTPFGGPTRI